MPLKLANGRAQLFARAAWLYFLLLFSWLALYLLFGDGTGYLGIANALAVYFFLPLPLAALFALLSGKRVLWIPALGALTVFFVLWGPLFFPAYTPVPEGPRLRVLTYNVLGRAGDYQAALDTILAEDADLLLLQEITPEIAAVFSVQLVDAYPFQVMQPASQARGLAVLSRFPLELLDVSLAGNWMGAPQILQLDWDGQPVTVVNFHTRPTGTFWPRWVRHTFAQRETDMQILADFASRQSELGPLIVAGDANVTHLNDAYKILAGVLQDAWWQAGSGLGHTFPGAIEEGTPFAQVSFFHIPYWLVRIDYIFYSPHWQAERTWLAEFNGGSDHRGVVTELVLLD